MKTAAFFFDTFLIKDKENYYGMTLTYDFFTKKYLKYYDKIIVSTRYKDKREEVGDISGYKQTNGKNVVVLPIKNYKKIPDIFLKKQEIKSEVKNILDQVDLAIIRMPSVIGSVACELCQELGVKYKIEMVACPFDSYWNHYNKLGKIIAPLMFVKTKKAIINAKEVMYVTNQFLQKRYPTKGESFACSDVILVKQPKETLEERKNRYLTSTNNSPIKLYTVANVGLKLKGQKYVIDALCKLNRNNNSSNKYQYYLIGSGSNEYLKKYAKEKNLEKDVIFLGSMSHDDIFRELRNADIYIQPSLTEGMPRSVIEAMSVGLPVIATMVGGNSELIDPEMTFKRKNVKQLVSILRNLNKKKIISYSKKNFENSQKYTEDRLSSIRKEFYLK